MRPLASGKALQAGSLLPAHLVVESSYHVASNNSLYSRRLNMSKTILITGASSGFGRDTAETLRHAGYTVYASMRGVQGKNREAAGALRKLGVKTVELDVSDDTSVEAGVKTVLAEAGQIDVLVNNAGIASAGVTEAFTTEQAKAIFDTNVIGLLRVTRAVLPSMRRQHDGLIINIGSILGRVTFPFVGIYGASKFAVEALTDSLRYEVSQLGVEVVEVQPSGYPTNFSPTFRRPRASKSSNKSRANIQRRKNLFPTSPKISITFGSTF